MKQPTLEKEIVLITNEDCILKADYKLSSKLQNIKKILIIKWGSLGDLIISSAIMQDIYNSFPDSIIELNTQSQWEEIFKNDLRFNEVWSINLKQNNIKNSLKWIKKVSNKKYDLIIDLQTNDRSRILLALLKIFYNSPTYFLGNHPIYPYNIKQSKRINTHAFNIQRQTLTTIGINPRTKIPKIFIENEWKNKASSLLSQFNLNKSAFGIFICGSNPNFKLKRWGVKNYHDLSKIIEKEYKNKYKIILIGGHDDQSEANRISSRNSNIINLCGKTSLLELPEIFKSAQWIVSNDTGPAHVASIVNTPMLIITGPTDPKKIKPIGNQIYAIKSSKNYESNIWKKDLNAKKIFPYVRKIIEK